MLQKPRQALNGNVHRRQEDNERVDYLSNEPCGLPVSAEEAHQRPQAGKGVACQNEDDNGDWRRAHEEQGLRRPTGEKPQKRHCDKRGTRHHDHVPEPLQSQLVKLAAQQPPVLAGQSTVACYA